MWTSDHPAAKWLAHDLAAAGLRWAVVSPGSRNAPLVLAFHHHPSIELVVAVDERSAAYIALGLALKNNTPAAVICTSGTAAVNFGPAIAEAFHQGVPLLAITADRPVSAIGKGHGQTVNQSNLFQAHTNFQTVLDESALSEFEMRSIISTCWQQAARGPVHVNVPFEEPLYGLVRAEEEALPTPAVFLASNQVLLPQPDIAADAKILLLLGPRAHDVRRSIPPSWSERMVVIADAFSGWFGGESSGDRWWRNRGGWLPDAVLTVGAPPMSKALRNGLQKAGARHIHIGPSPLDFLDRLEHLDVEDPIAALDELVAALAPMELPKFVQPLASNVAPIQGVLTDYKVYAAVAGALEEGSVVHAANSTSARYVQLVDWRASRLHANRGVAGIDGCTSTAVGEALANRAVPVVLMSGDLAFLYDLNGLWVDPEPTNLRVVVIDNGGGAIFRWIDGPKESGLLSRYFEGGECRTDSAGGRRSIEQAVNSVGGQCLHALSEKELVNGVKWLFDGTQEGVKVLCVHTDAEASDREHKQLLGE